MGPSAVKPSVTLVLAARLINLRNLINLDRQPCRTWVASATTVLRYYLPVARSLSSFISSIIHHPSPIIHQPHAPHNPRKLRFTLLLVACAVATYTYTYIFTPHHSTKTNKQQHLSCLKVSASACHKQKKLQPGEGLSELGLIDNHA